MFRGENKAFTIIEVILFIAISGAMILIAMRAVGSSQAEVQFTDSMRSLQSFIETQFSAATNGVNDNQTAGSNCAASGGDSGCVMLGRVIIFEKDSSSVSYYSLLGKRLNADDEANATDTILYAAEPETELAERKYDIVWGSEFKKGEHTLPTGSQEYSQAFGFVRNPRASNTAAITYSSLATDTAATVLGIINNVTTYHSTSTIISTDENVDAYYCFASVDGDRHAVITLNGAQVDLLFEGSPNFVVYNCN